MFIEKPKRKQKPAKKSVIRSLLIVLMIAPIAFIALNPVFGQSLLADGIALSVMICAAVYIVHQGIVWLIAAYLHTPGEAPVSDASEISI